MEKVKTSKVVASMLVISFAISVVMAYLQFSAFFLSVFLVPAFLAAYYQWRHGIRFEKHQRKSISIWYVGITFVIGIIPLAMVIDEAKDKLNEPLSQVLIALVFGILVLMLLAYFLVYWVLGMEFIKNSANQTPNN